MSIDALPGWAERIAEAFKAAGPDVVEKTISRRRAYVVGERMFGDLELGDDSLRVHLRLAERERDVLAARTHLDPHAADTLVIVTEDDRDFALEMIPHAYRHARSAPAERARQTPVEPAASPARRRTTPRRTR